MMNPTFLFYQLKIKNQIDKRCSPTKFFFFFFYHRVHYQNLSIAKLVANLAPKVKLKSEKYSYAMFWQ